MEEEEKGYSIVLGVCSLVRYYDRQRTIKEADFIDFSSDPSPTSIKADFGKQAVPSSLPYDVKHHLAGFDGITPPNLANIAISQNKVLVTVSFTAKEA